MNKLIMIILLTTLSACSTRTDLGECIGADDREDKRFLYDVNLKNVIIGILFFQTVLVPINVVGWNLKCPMELK